MAKINKHLARAGACIAVLTSYIPVQEAAASSLLTMGPRGVQALVSGQLFNRMGRWYLIDDGACHTYLESPRTHIDRDRIVLSAHLTARLGQRMGDSCAGADFASNVTLSGRLRGGDHTMVLEDIRIDQVDDEATRNALNLAQQLVPDTIPRAANVDVLELVRNQLLPNGTLDAHLEQLHILGIATRPNAIAITFDLNLSAP